MPYRDPKAKSAQNRRYRQERRHTCLDCDASIDMRSMRCHSCADRERWQNEEKRKVQSRLMRGNRYGTGNANNLQHGHTRNSRGSREYHTWMGMLQRCLNPKAKGFEYYGGRGIRVHGKWLMFDGFLAWLISPDGIGLRPKERSLDRIDNDGDYRPGNVRWATQLEQARNRSNKVDDAMIERINSLRARGYTQRKISQTVGISQWKVWNILKNRDLPSSA